MAKAENKGFTSDFRQFFARGLATLLPTVLTIVVLVKCFEFVQTNISIHITRGVSWVTVKYTNYPTLTPEELDSYQKENKLAQDWFNDPKLVQKSRHDKMTQDWSNGPKSLVGFAIAIVLVYVLGRLLASFIGRRLWNSFEVTVARVPLFKQIYPYVKQVTEFLFGENKIEFNRVVGVEYPRKGLWSIGLVTGESFKKINETANDELLSIFIPSSPTPVTGYVITVSKNDVIDLPITIEEALRFTISGGVIVPDHQVNRPNKIELIPGPVVTDHQDEKQSN